MSLKIIIPALVLAIANGGTIAVAADNAAAGWGAPENSAKAQPKTATKTSKPAKAVPKPKTASAGQTTQASATTSANTNSATKAAVKSVTKTTEQSSGAPADPTAAAKEAVSAWKEKHDELWRGQ